MKKIHLIIIDPQNDFCDSKGTLYVPGAEMDIKRLSKLIENGENKLHAIHCTLDSHHTYDISHPIFWSDDLKNHPSPFTIISKEDVIKESWKTTDPKLQNYGLEYVARLEENKRYPLCIWPPHCLIGTNGHSIVPELSETLLSWEHSQLKTVNYISKGDNFKTEHYSAIKADVEDPDDSSTELNKKLLQNLEEADEILFAGEASSHCLKFTVEDIANNINKEQIKKMVLLTDCCSPVEGFEKESDEFIKIMKTKGMQVSDSISYKF